MTTLRLPVPPSINAAYANRKHGRGKGRYKTAKYTAWLRDADRYALAQKINREWPIGGQRELYIKLPKIRGDASNRIKLIEDYLVSRLITTDDKHNRKVTVEIDESLDQLCEVTVRAA